MTTYANGERPKIGDEIECTFTAKVTGFNHLGEPWVECERDGGTPDELIIHDDEPGTSVRITKPRKTPGQVAFEAFYDGELTWPGSFFPEHWERAAKAVLDNG